MVVPRVIIHLNRIFRHINFPSIPPDPKERGQRCAEDVQPKHAALLADAVGVQGRQIDAQETCHARGDVVLKAGDNTG